MKNKTRIFISLLVICLLVPIVNARVKLVTLPPRSTVIVNLDNPNYNLVMEERIVTLQNGENTIDFSWQGVSIDPQSIQFEPISHPENVNVLSVSYPPNENALVWTISSGFAGEEKVRIYYLLTGLNRNVSYRAQVNNAESSAILKSYFKLINASGEDFENANIAVGYGDSWDKSIRNNESKEMLSFDVSALPVKKLFIYEYEKDPEKTLMYYEIKNTKEFGLGEFLLKPGKVRIFQTDKSDASIFLGEDWLKETPVNEKAQVYLGVAKDLVVKRHIMEDKKVNIRRNISDNEILYDRSVHLKFDIENFKAAAQEIKLIEHIDDYWRINESTIPYTRTDARTYEITTQLPPKGEKKSIDVIYKQLNQMSTVYMFEGVR